MHTVAVMDQHPVREERYPLAACAKGSGGAGAGPGAGRAWQAGAGSAHGKAGPARADCSALIILDP